ncbi:MAG: MbtH family protein [Janthinobacterium lividum]
MTHPASSTTADDSQDVHYTVVLNDEEQYSIWPTYRAVPPGWRETGVRGPKAVCLEHIETVWTDMRPASLRRHMAQAAASQPEIVQSAMAQPGTAAQA